jgi:hypothetical protein
VFPGRIEEYHECCVRSVFNDALNHLPGENEEYHKKPQAVVFPSSRLGGVTSVLAIGSKVRGFKLGRGGGLLRAIKIRSTFLRRGSKAVGPMS